MVLSTWILIANIFGNVFKIVWAGQFPSFFDDEDLKNLGVKHHHAANFVPPVTGRYTNPKALQNNAMFASEQFHHKIPPNGYPINQLAYSMANPKPFKPPARGDPRDQNIVQQIGDIQDEQVFPEPDGKPFAGEDSKYLDELPKRLTETNKWDEFYDLLAEEREKRNGQIMKNWEEDAHKWAGYSKHLLERAAHEKQKQAARMQPQVAPRPNPSLGLEAYWGDPEPQQEPEPQVPKGRPGPSMWNRRFQNPDVYNDNIEGPMEHSVDYPPIYYKENNMGQPGYQPGPQPNDALRSRPTKDRDYLLPGDNLQSMHELDYPEGLREGELERYLPPYPPVEGSLGPEGQRPGSFDPTFSLDQVPTGNVGVMPGTGAARTYPNGFRPNYGKGNPPLELSQYPMNYGKSLGRSSDSMSPGMNQGGVRYPMNPRMAPAPSSYAMGQKYSQAKPFGQREGGGYPPLDDYGGAGPADYPDDYKPGLRMGGPGSFQNQPGPGSEGDFPDGYRPSVPGGNMERGSPPGGMMGGPPPGAMHRGPGGIQGRGRGMKGRGSPGGAGPESREDPVYPDGAGGNSLPNYGQSGYGPSADQGPPPEQGNRNQNIPRGAYGPKPSRIPSGYALLSIAKKKLEAAEHMERLATPLRELPTNVTTTERQLTKDEIIKGLRQFDDFHAPVRWVKFNTPDVQDGLARVTDKKTHQNQQFVIEGELYVPIVDESMARLGWTTEDPNIFTTITPAPPPPNDSSIKLVLRSMDLNKTDEREWLAFETILGAKKVYGHECDSDSCQARCHQTGCDAVCKGDTCATGCVGTSCNSICKGPGCFSMCIGEQCTAKCEGLNCESRCWGKSCEATCTNFSCSYTTNGNSEQRNNATWDQMYPQYGMRHNPDVFSQGSAPGPPPNGNADYYD